MRHDQDETSPSRHSGLSMPEPLRVKLRAPSRVEGKAAREAPGQGVPAQAGELSSCAPASCGGDSPAQFWRTLSQKGASSSRLRLYWTYCQRRCVQISTGQSKGERDGGRKDDARPIPTAGVSAEAVGGQDRRESPLPGVAVEQARTHSADKVDGTKGRWRIWVPPSEDIGHRAGSGR